MTREAVHGTYFIGRHSGVLATKPEHALVRGRMRSDEYKKSSIPGSYQNQRTSAIRGFSIPFKSRNSLINLCMIVLHTFRIRQREFKPHEKGIWIVRENMKVSRISHVSFLWKPHNPERENSDWRRVKTWNGCATPLLAQDDERLVITRQSLNELV